MKFITKLKFILTITITAGHAYATDTKEKIEHSMASVEKECAGYASVLTNAKWEAVKSKAKEQGKEIPDNYRDSLYKIELYQCVTIQKIQIMNMVKGITSESEWSKMGGETTLKRLNNELKKTI
ncbi:hypothetical protein SAMN05216214_1282 [Atopomonas hussainii]|uniref:Uncharacterized protein n=1 Tax=Atopomonas hussainii TaxID=1429083 RepID=A0A1H7TF74_9GAMM|nr:hypothetical protein [Atopomonas hussainii]SEL82956.1 hypothetical protein SAMN05216214_1282 [Atopomonas hussainii]